MAFTMTSLICFVSEGANSHLRHLRDRVYVQILEQFCKILSGIHEIDCMHNDIHVGNIIVNYNSKNPPDVHIFLIDFGESRCLNEKSLQPRQSKKGSISRQTRFIKNKSTYTSENFSKLVLDCSNLNGLDLAQMRKILYRWVV